MGDGRRLNGTLFDIGVAQLLYDGKSSWSTLADALDAAEHGDGSDLASYADLYTGRNDGGRYDDLQDAFIAIGCADGPPTGDLASLRVIEDQAAAAAPRLGRSIVNNSLACALWPVAAPAPTPVRAPDAARLLVLGTRDDPATPLSWARRTDARARPGDARDGRRRAPHGICGREHVRRRPRRALPRRPRRAAHRHDVLSREELRVAGRRALRRSRGRASRPR